MRRQKYSYHRCYTSEKGQGSVWDRVKETGDVTQGERANRETDEAVCRAREQEEQEKRQE